MQCCVNVPWSFPLILFISLTCATSVHSQPISTCSNFLSVNATDIRTGNQQVYPCPVAKPCQCVCEPDNRRLWIDCFHRQLKSFPQFQPIFTDEKTIEWNVDFAFNLFENATHRNQTHWLPSNLRIRHFVLSSALNYDLIEQLNLTHRHLVDRWPSRMHFEIVDSDEQVRRRFFSLGTQRKPVRILLGSQTRRTTTVDFGIDRRNARKISSHARFPFEFGW